MAAKIDQDRHVVWARPLAVEPRSLAGRVVGVGNFRAASGMTASSGCATSADFYNDAMFALATTAAAIALGSLFLLLRGAPRWFSLAAAVGVDASGIANSVEHCLAEPFFLLFAAGLLVYVLASCALGAAWVMTASKPAVGPSPIDCRCARLELCFERGAAAVTGVVWLLLRVVRRDDQQRENDQRELILSL